LINVYVKFSKPFNWSRVPIKLIHRLIRVLFQVKDLLSGDHSSS
jgi:hypothetical protein